MERINEHAPESESANGRIAAWLLMRSTACAYSHQGHGPRADQQAGYIKAISENTHQITCEQQPVHTFALKPDCCNAQSLGSTDDDQAAGLTLHSTLRPAAAARLVSASRLKRSTLPRSRSLRRGCVTPSRFEASACVMFQAPTVS